VPLDAPDHSLENIAHLAGLQMPETLPDKLGALLVPGAIENDCVQMWVEPEVGRCPLHDGDRGGLRAGPARSA